MLAKWHNMQPNLNKFLAMGRPAWKEARATLQKLLSGRLDAQIASFVHIIMGL